MLLAMLLVAYCIYYNSPMLLLVQGCQRCSLQVVEPLTCPEGLLEGLGIQGLGSRGRGRRVGPLPNSQGWIIFGWVHIGGERGQATAALTPSVLPSEAWGWW